MRSLIEIKFGSRLYGTATPQSDLDFKGVHLPDARSLLLQRVKGVIHSSTSDSSRRNDADDTDRESYVLQKYLGLVAEGQTVALDMLFAPQWSWTTEPEALWLEIISNKDRLLTSQYAAFVGYCRTQASRYSVRGSRVAAARAALGLLTVGMKQYGTTAKLLVLTSEIEAMSGEHIAIVDIDSPNGGHVRHWQVCERKMPYTASIKTAADIMRGVVAEYGHRALAAEQNQGVDWKAVSHAVRIAKQAIELLETGVVTFPRPEAAHLVAIKSGLLPYQGVADEIDRLLIEVEQAAKQSSLPANPDMAWIEDLVANAYREVIMLDNPAAS